jgi:hypothetical protein
MYCMIIFLINYNKNKIFFLSIKLTLTPVGSGTALNAYICEADILDGA